MEPTDDHVRCDRQTREGLHAVDPTGFAVRLGGILLEDLVAERTAVPVERFIPRPN